MKKYVFSIAAVAAMFASCSQDSELEVVDNGPKAQAITTITASTESENGTRAVVDGTSINWETGDQIGAFESSTPENYWKKATAYTLEGQGGDRFGIFKNEDSSLQDIAAIMYPCQAGADFTNHSGTQLNYDIPTVQTGVRGSFDKNAAIMYNLDGGSDLSLGVNFLRVHIGEANIHSVTVSSPTSQLSGRVDSNGGCPDANNNVKSVTLVAGENINDCFKAGVYYIAVKRGDIANPTISYVYAYPAEHAAEERYKTSTGTISFETGKNVKDISVTWGRKPNSRSAVQLWAGGPYFAEENASSSRLLWQAGMDAWGANWTIPSEDQMNALFNTSNTTFAWTTNPNGSDYGFKFTGKESGYMSVSLFLPAEYSRADYGNASYWSGTAVGDTQARCVFPESSSGNLSAPWYNVYRTSDCCVRLVLKN